MSTVPESVTVPRRGVPRALSVAGAGALLIALAACEEDIIATGPSTGDFVAEAAAVDQNASVDLREEVLPAGSADGPDTTVEGDVTVINGGSALVTLSADEEFDRVLVGVQAIAGAEYTVPDEPQPGPLLGYYEVGLAGPVTEAELVLTMAQQLPTDRFELGYAVVTAAGVQSEATTQAVEAVTVGSGEVQVSVAWDRPSDVDLYVVDPSGTEIYYGNTEAESGGRLDLDSNADCRIDGTNNENITFDDAPPGEYTVRVNYWSSCDEDRTRYVVTVRVGDEAPQRFEGEFTGDGERGGAGAGEVVTTFTVAR